MIFFSLIRSLIAVIFFPIFLVFCSLLGLLVNFIFNNRKLDNAIVKLWTMGTCRMFGVKVDLQGAENIPQGQGAVFLFNHTSFFDIFALNGVIPPIRFGAKIELFKIPIFGPAMLRMGVLPIARKNKEEVFRVYENAQKNLEKGQFYALSPEGTRQEEEKLASFKSGPFVFAINAKALLVPVIIKGAAYALPKDSYLPMWRKWSHTITVKVLPAIDTKPYTVDQRPELQKKVFAVMSSNY